MDRRSRDCVSGPRARRYSLLALAALLLLAVACRPNASPRPTSSSTAAAGFAPAHIDYTVVGYSWDLAPDLVAEAKGFYSKRNLTVDYTVSGQAAQSCQQILAKAAQAGICSPNDMIQADEVGGAHLIQIMNQTVTALQYGVVTKPTISSWADLKGKTIIITGPKENTTYYLRVMARANGLKDGDYTLQFAGSSSARLAALKSGAVDAAVLSDPTYAQALQAGFKSLDQLVPKYLNASNYSGGGPAVSADWAKANPDAVARLIAGLLEANRWIDDPANKDALYDVIHDKLNLTRDVFDQLYKDSVVDNPQWSQDGKIDDKGIEGIEKGLVDLGSLKEPIPPASKYYDASYLASAQKLLGK
jgi:NitT/TauT family transport system substrate-binding protein